MTLATVLTWLCVVSCFVSAYLCHDVIHPRLSSQLRGQLAAWNLVLVAAITLLFLAL